VRAVGDLAVTHPLPARAKDAGELVTLRGHQPVSLDPEFVDDREPQEASRLRLDVPTLELRERRDLLIAPRCDACLGLVTGRNECGDEGAGPGFERLSYALHKDRV
jgi:hypothetical protein